MSEPLPLAPENGAAPTEHDGDQPADDFDGTDDLIELTEYVSERAW